MIIQDYFRLFINNPINFVLNGVTKNHELLKKDFIKKEYNFDKIPELSFPALKEEITINPYIFQFGNSTIPDIILLKYLAKQIVNCKFLEIGSWKGETLKNLEPHCKQMTSVTLGKDDMKKMGLSDEFIQQNGLFQKTIKNLNEIFANTHSFDFAELEQKFDLIFIDGDHSYKGVLNDTKKVFENCVHENSIVVWHDYKDSSGIRYSVLAGIFDGVPRKIIPNIFHFQHTLCAVYIPDKFLSFFSKRKFNHFDVFNIKINESIY